ncbi:MAG: prolipoprotein diacylglyceryl transferase [Candidatus Omnitrophica bacterium]|nr:prolipoprotein diacylglyceryl transferase [Candidatus Omnitrophota bacterium]
MKEFWQHIPEKINPVFLSLGPLDLRYYGMMYVLAIITGYFLFLYRVKRESFPYPEKKAEDFFLWMVIGVILGGRLGYVLFYGFDYYIQHPLEIFLPFQFEGGVTYTGITGMSYHGGLAGAVLAALWFCRKSIPSFWTYVDYLMPCIPAGYTFGRIGNFLNGELFGRVTSAPWGMYFPADPLGKLRHPSQLYEAFFEGVLLFVILWSIRKKNLFPGFLFSVYLLGYGFVRFFIEFTREPDAHIGFVFGSLTMGQILCLGMIFIAVLFLIFLPKPQKTKAS